MRPAIVYVPMSFYDANAFREEAVELAYEIEARKVRPFWRAVHKARWLIYGAMTIANPIGGTLAVAGAEGLAALQRRILAEKALEAFSRFYDSSHGVDSIVAWSWDYGPFIVGILNDRFVDEFRLTAVADAQHPERQYFSDIKAPGFYITHPIYERLVDASQYFQAMLAEKLYYWTKLLVELGARSIDLTGASEEFISSKVGESWTASNLETSSLQADEKHEEKTASRIGRLLTFPANKPATQYCHLAPDDYDAEGRYLFRSQLNRLEAYKLFRWVYYDDHTLRNLLEARLRQLNQDTDVAELSFDAHCAVDKLVLDEATENALTHFGALKSELTSIAKSQMSVDLSVKF